MFDSTISLITTRFIFSKHHSFFTRLTHTLATLGIALGVAILIIINAIFNGVEDKIKENFTQMHTHLTIRSPSSDWVGWEKVAQELSLQKDIIAIQPQIRFYAVIQSQSHMMPVMLYAPAKGYEPTWMQSSEENVDKVQQTPAWLHEGLLETLYLEHGDSLSLMSARVQKNHIDPLVIRINIVGTFKRDNLLEPMNNTIYMELEGLQQALNLSNKSINEIAITTNDMLRAPKVAQDLKKYYPSLIVESWTDNARTLIDSLQIQKKMMIIVLSLVTCIASFNLITGLVILVMDKRKEIAVLQTMGMSKTRLFWVFILQGMWVASLGALIGFSIGLPLAWYLTEIVMFMENLLEVKLFSEQVFMLSYLPSKVVLKDLLAIIFFTEVLAFFASVYPAKQALRVQPADTIRHE